MKISITKEEIKEGKPRNGVSCPVALAITKATGIKRISVAGPWAVLNDRVQVNLPHNVYLRILRFDNPKGKMTPFSFDLPDKAIKSALSKNTKKPIFAIFAIKGSKLTPFDWKAGKKKNKGVKK